jgi:HPt (histidine-containing phosphotransfer) domain-containing protein
MPDLPPIDPEAIAGLRELNAGDGGEFLREIVGIYVEDTPKRILEMRTSLAAGDLPTFTRAAHTVKGSSANLGAQGVRGVAERLEKMARTSGLAGVASLVDECEAQFRLAADELRRLAT